MSSLRSLRGARIALAGSVGAATLLALESVPASAAPPAASVHATRSLAVRGTLIARDAVRHTLVVTTANGTVRTLRIAAVPGAARLALGTEVLVRGSGLADGSLRAARLVAVGHVRRAHVRATVVASSATRLLLSAGGSVFAVAGRPGIRAHVGGLASGAPAPGDVVSATVAIGPSSLEQTAIQQVGQTTLVDLNGTLASLGASSIVVAVEQGADTTVTLPPSVTLPSSVAVGDQVEVVAAYANQAFSLVTIVDDSLAATTASQGVTTGNEGAGQSVLRVEGTVVSVDTTALVVQPGDGASPVTLAVPAGVDLTGVVVGAQVEATASSASGTLTLATVDVVPSQDGSTSSVEGTVVSVDATALVVQPGDGASPVTLAVPAGVDLTGVVVGATVHVKTAVVGGVTTVTSVEVQGSGGSSSGSGSSTGDGSGGSSSGSGSSTGDGSGGSGGSGGSAGGGTDS